MKGQITLWGCRSAFNVQKILWMLGELELPHEYVGAGGAAGGLNASEFLAMNPNGRIPVLRDGTHVIWESRAILSYDRLFELLDQHLETNIYLGGNSFTVADIPAGTMLYRYHEMDVPRASSLTLKPGTPACIKGKAFQDHITVPFDELKGRLDF